MTMVLDNQGRHYGNIGYPDNMYSSQLHSSPQFTDPWGVPSTTQSHTSAYAASLPKQEVSRAMPISFSQNPVSAPSMVSGSSYSSAGFGASDLLSLPQDIPRSTYSQDQTYQTSAQTNNTFSAYPSLNYTQSIHQQQQQQQDVRKMSESYVYSVLLAKKALLMQSRLEVNTIRAQNHPALASLMRPEGC
jgi:hypothetical protein